MPITSKGVNTESLNPLLKNSNQGNAFEWWKMIRGRKHILSTTRS